MRMFNFSMLLIGLSYLPSMAFFTLTGWKYRDHPGEQNISIATNEYLTNDRDV